MSARPQQNQIYIWAVTWLVMYLTGCQDFSRFNCFQESSGCSPISESDEVETPRGEISTLDQGLDDSVNQPLDQQTVDDMEYDGQIDASDPRDGGLDGEPGGEPDELLDAEVTVPPDPLEQCQEDITLDLGNPNIDDDVIHWHCLEDESGRIIQIMVAEMTTAQVMLTWRYFLGLCNSLNDNPLTSKLCEDLSQFDAYAYRDELRYEWQLRINVRPDDRQLQDEVQHTSITDLTPAEVSHFVSTLNTWAEVTAHPYRYQLPSFALWQRLAQMTDVNQHSCAASSSLRGVYRGAHEFDHRVRDGCNFRRPRTVSVGPQTTQCYDRVWAFTPMGTQVTEDRRLTLDLPLCDLHGNVREMLEECPDTVQMCTLGGGWRSTHLDRDMRTLDANRAEIDLGFRLLRYRVP